ncbi:MAG: hypothetical protein AAB425_09650 [Bdellovibrionota bacterium]
MHPKAKSSTKSLKSDTSRKLALDTPVQYVKGVGPGLGHVFTSRGFATVGDLITFFPRDYEDRTKVSTVSDLATQASAPLLEGGNPGSTAGKITIPVKVLSKRVIPIRGRGTSILEAICADPKGDRVSLKWFHAPRGLEARLATGTAIVVTGKPKIYQGRPEFIHPEMNFAQASVESAFSGIAARSHPAPVGTPVAQPPLPAIASSGVADRDFGRMVPVYVEIEGIATRLLRKVLWESLEKFSAEIPDDLPPDLTRRHGLPDARTAIRGVHFPPETATLDLLQSIGTPAQKRII